MLKIGKKPCEWIVPEVSGKPPLARYGHTMNYYPQKAMLIIFGGRNDENSNNGGQEYLNDVWILDLENMRWTMWDNKDSMGSIPVARYSHSSAVLGTSIIVFGGLSEENYCKGDVYVLDMERVYEAVDRRKGGSARKKATEERKTPPKGFRSHEEQPVANISGMQILLGSQSQSSSPTSHLLSPLTPTLPIATSSLLTLSEPSKRLGPARSARGSRDYGTAELIPEAKGEDERLRQVG